MHALTHSGRWGLARECCAKWNVLQGPISYSAGSSLRLNVQVQGLGPFFKLKLTLQNTGTKPIMNVPLLMTCNPTYHIDTPQVLLRSTSNMNPNSRVLFERARKGAKAHWNRWPFDHVSRTLPALLFRSHAH